MSHWPFRVGVSLALIATGIVAARHLEPTAPSVSVSQPTQALVLGTALGGPFVAERLHLLPDADGWDVVAALALSLGLFLLAIRLVGVDGGSRSGRRC